ncbi:MAG: PAAR domain-containing protein [Thiohalomonadales bacterium]
MPNAARQGDLTAHGGVIVSGINNVLIEGKPAARAGDNHICPMCNPGTPPPPHVGGPIAQGSATVLIGGLAAARVGDVCVCLGPPDCIVQGSASVIIGDANGSGGDGGGGASAQASKAALTAIVGTPGEQSLGKHWVKYQTCDESKNPVNGIAYEINFPGMSKPVLGHLSGNGTVKLGGLGEAGDCNLQLKIISDVVWSTTQANLGDTVELSAKLAGMNTGTDIELRIFAQDRKGNNREIDRIITSLNGEDVKAEWVYARGNSLDREQTDTGLFYFEVHCEDISARSALLRYNDWIDIEIENVDKHVGKIIQIISADGSFKQSSMSQSGRISLEGLSPGEVRILFEDGIEIILESRQ